MLQSRKLNKVKGDLGEMLACVFLRKNKYKILEKNFKNKVGEIDIIARLKKILVFVEVKNRSSDRFGLPCEAVGTFKQEKIKKVALSYLKAKNLLHQEIRFDVVEVFNGEINHIVNAF